MIRTVSAKVEIDKYMEIVNEFRNSIISIQSEKYTDIHKKTLLFSLLDMMSKAVLNQMRSNRDRFVNFVLQFGNWKHANYVSLPQLKMVIEGENTKNLDKMKDIIAEKLQNWPSDKPVLLDIDSNYKDLEKYWPRGYRVMGKIGLRHLRHCDLLWTLRNSFIHEMREPGQDYQLYNLTVPHYTPRYRMMKDGKNGRMKYIKVWELIYPLEFLIEIVDDSIESIKNYMIKNNINPFINYRFDTLWPDIRR